jgi:non-specific serine/threonine protein kinase
MPGPRDGAAAIAAATALTSFAGRDRELTAVRRLLVDDAVRLVTLTGPGGVGKTQLAVRLAREIAQDFPGGAWLVSLAPVRDPALVVSAIAQALNVPESNRRTLVEGIVARVGHAPTLLVIDNFEHVADEAPLVTDLLASCPGLTCLVTSRVLLQVSGEHAYPVPPLALPPSTIAVSVEHAARSPAVQLFVSRARSVRADFALTDANASEIETICRRLGGVPLAIELAAARVRHLTLRELTARLDTAPMGVLKGGPRDAPARLRTMRNAIAWSYALLSDAEQAVLRRISVFVGGFTLEAATAVVRDADIDEVGVEEALIALVDHSLVQAEGDGVTRYGLLETVREFGREQLGTASEETVIHQRYLAWWVEQVTMQWNRLLSEQLSPNAWLVWADAEQDNVRAALRWCLERGQHKPAVWLAGAFHWFWEYRGHFREGVRWLDRALATEDGIPAQARAWALEGRGVLSGLQGDWALAIACLEQSLALDRQIDDRRGVARAEMNLGIRWIDSGEYDRAIPLLEEAEGIYASLGSIWGAALSRAHRGSAYFGKGDLATAAGLFQASWEQARLVNDPLARFMSPLFLALLACEQREPRVAARWFREVVAFYAPDGGLVAAWYRDPDGAARTLASVAVLAGIVGDPIRAARLLGAAKRPQEEIGLAFAFPERATFQRLETETRRLLGDARFEEAWTAGYRLEPPDVASEVEVVLVTAGTVASAADSVLTGREHEVLRLIVDGRTDREIGDTLFISHRTVNKHVANILAKLDVPTRGAAAARAKEAGLT